MGSNTMTPTDLETYVRQRYNAVGDSFFPQSEIFNYFFSAEMELARESLCIKRTYTTTSVASQRIYDFPTSTLSIRRVEYDGERIFPNDFSDDDALTGNDPDGAITGRPENYQQWGSQIYLRPIPDTSALTIKIYSYDMPSQPTAGGTLDIPEIYHLDLADYALYCMFGKDKSYQMANYHLNIWNKKKIDVIKTERSLLVGDEFQTVKDIDELVVSSRFF